MRLKVIRFLRLHFIIAILYLIIFSAKGVGGAQKRGGKYTVMAKKMDLGALRQQIMELQIDKELKHDLLEVINEKKHYGLVWEESSEEAWDEMQDKLPVFVEDATKRLDSAPEGSPNHVLIEADNLNALAALTYAYAGKIDVIYIDPPYNTGNKDFIYNDSFVDKEDGYRHSKWLSFMNRRLNIAKQLLSERGVIFISIDDNEQAQLKLLCDKYFGNSNFLGQLVLKTATDNNPSQINIEHEYMLCYCMFKCMQNNWKRQSKASKMILEKYRELRLFYDADNNTIQKELRKWIRTNKSSLTQVSHYNNVDSKGVYSSSSNSSNPHPGGYDYDIIHPLTGKACPKPSNGWRWPFVTFKKYDDMGEIKWGKDETTQPHVKKRIETSTEYLRTLIYEDNRGTTKELTDMFGGKKVFDNPKPYKVLTRILDFASSKDSTILDFFAGSGTTLHATMQLNSEDGGHRKCILVTNNENNICEKVTYERNKRVINGYTNQKGEEVPGLTHNNLRYYKTEFVPRDQSNFKSRRALMASLVDLLCIKNNIYKEQETFGGKKFKKNVLRYFKDEAGQMLVVLDERVVSIIIPMIAEVATKQNPLKVYVYSDGAYAYEDEFHKVMPVIELCAMPDAFLQALEGGTDILPKQKYSEAMMKEFQQNEALAMQNEEVVKEALSDDYDYVLKEKEDNVTNDIID